MSCRRIVVLREVSSSARGDDDRHARREEQRASGLAKVVKSNLGKPGLSKHRVVHLTDEIALAEIISVLEQNILSSLKSLLARHCGYRVAMP
jgi:hypothetical protein